MNNFLNYFDNVDSLLDLFEERVEYWKESRIKQNGKELIHLIATASHIVFYDEVIGKGQLKEYDMTIEQVSALRDLLGEDKFLDTTLEWREHNSYLLLNKFWR